MINNNWGRNDRNIYIKQQRNIGMFDPYIIYSKVMRENICVFQLAIRLLLNKNNEILNYEYPRYGE